jgi:hypothetical protein
VGEWEIQDPIPEEMYYILFAIGDVYRNFYPVLTNYRICLINRLIIMVLHATFSIIFTSFYKQEQFIYT